MIIEPEYSFSQLITLRAWLRRSFRGIVKTACSRRIALYLVKFRFKRLNLSLLLLYGHAVRSYLLLLTVE